MSKIEQSHGDMAKAIHYPECWDTAAYPTVEIALAEVAATFRCTNQDTHELVTLASAEQAIEHVSQHNGPGREAEARGMLVHLDAAEPSPRIGAIVAKMRADLQALGGFDNGMLSVPAEGVRTYIERLEAALAASSQPQGEQSTAPESPQAAAQSTALEPVAVVGSKDTLLWAGGDAIEDIVRRHGLRVGSKLYATPEAALALLGEAQELVQALDNYVTFPPSIKPPLDRLRARIDALTGTGRKEQSNG